MEELELEYNDYVSYIFIFTIINGVHQYYFSNKDEWLMDNWPSLNKDRKLDISKILIDLSEDKISVELLKKEFKRLHADGQSFVIETHLPMLYIDFDKKILKSRYYEQSLHHKILGDWIGKYENFLDEIPKEFKYWIKPTESI